MKVIKLSIFFFLIALSSKAQEKKQIMLEDIWQKGTFSAKSVAGINWTSDGRFYTSLVADASGNSNIVKFETTSGNAVDTVLRGRTLKLADGSTLEIDEYQFDASGNQVLLTSNFESIYRRSYKADFYIYDFKSKSLKPVSTAGKQSYTTFSPDGLKLAFTRDNNLFFVDINSGAEKQLTTDGKWNFIINGSTDWVYEEEFSFAQAFFWSPDSKSIAFYTFDESKVKEYNMQLWGDLYPKDYKFKYPKAGEANSTIKINVTDVSSGKISNIDLGDDKDVYIPRINWTSDPSILSVRKLNRLQNKLEIIHVNVISGQRNVVLSEESKSYVDVENNDELTYLKDKKSFLHASEKDGFKHLYLHAMDGKLINQITIGKWEVSEVAGIDEKAKLVYYVSTEDSPLERQLYSISFNGKNKKKITQNRGTYSFDFSPDLKYFLSYFTTANTPNVVSLHEAPSGKVIKVLQDNAELVKKMGTFNLSKKEFFSFKLKDSETTLNGYTIKPANFDASKKYPVLMFVYGGPGSQQVLDSWGGGNYFWFQMLAQKGYIIACVDNRGTGARGKDFKHITYAQLGKIETEDQIEAAKYIGSLGYVDASRIGIWGWSYGGYMSSLCLFKGADVFKTAIAVAPVTNWRFYDTVYTERFLKTPQENASGYDDNSPLNHVSKLKGNLFLVHGTGDDNVHFQNSVEMQNALIKANKQFESFFYPNRNHGISGGNTRLHLYNAMTDFIQRKL